MNKKINTGIVSVTEISVRKDKNGNDVTCLSGRLTGKWNSETNTRETTPICIFYANNMGENIARGKDRLIGKKSVVSYTEQLFGTKKVLFGTAYPVLKGIVEIPLSVNPDADEAAFAKAKDSLNICVSEDGMDPSLSEFDRENPEEILQLSDMLNSMDTKASKNARYALLNLVKKEHWIYVGYIASIQAVENPGKTPYTKLSFALPAKEGQPAEFVYASAFRDNKARLDKIVHKGDNVILYLDTKKEFEKRDGSTAMSFCCYNFELLGKAESA